MEIAKMDLRARVGVDIGGTFTDVALEYPGGLATAKVLTNYSQPEQAIIDGIEKAARKADIPLDRIGQVIHGTTLVTNALIERKGARLAFVTTEGFRDVVEMRSENRFEQYDLNITLPQPLVMRQDRYTVRERVAADGSVLRPLDRQDVDRVVKSIRDQKYEAVAIGFIHAYANGRHEKEMADALKAACPDVAISLSSVVSPQIREFERFNTVIANAYVQPMVASYLNRLVRRLGERGINAAVYMMHSGGGLISVENAVEQPVRLLESGPAGGAIFAANYARAHGFDKVVSFDMGGTTAKICLIEGGTPKTASLFEVARTYRFKKGSGMPVSTPVVEMVEIGAGGGSIASIDSMGRIRVGPRSAASEPGPACYQRGGTEPTVTDANLILGRLDPDNFAGGEIHLSVPNADNALATHLCGPAAATPSDAAFGVTEMVDENMANAARAHTIENGRDVQSFTMIAFGGGAPLHASRQCEKLGIDRLLIPPGAGVGSAIGFLRAPFSYEASRGFFQRLATMDIQAVSRMLAVLEDEARAFVASCADEIDITAQRTAFMRYAGQGWEIPVPLAIDIDDATDPSCLRAAFEECYRRLFGRIIDGLEVEITNWSVLVTSRPLEVPPVARRSLVADPITGKPRRFYDAAQRRLVEGQEVERAAMLPGAAVVGPAVIIESETSTVITSAFSAVMQDDGSLLVIKKEKHV
ncbi:hydantoinase/oxoprolinase family protein [Ferrovibrio xuzhouensis]|uniref:Hydantoinase/oxoprolinase family protein n=1 Tax=Ferrovibrio xuzhouensis TaxID=1576914 RepID=A0ABV7VNB3_9PROT